MKKACQTAVINFLICSIFISCNSDNTTKEQTNTAVEQPSTPIDELAEYRFSYTIANLPPPMQVLDEFSKAGLPVNVSLLNSQGPENYHSENKIAFNYGIYGIDLAYSVFNERTPEMLKYYATVKALAEELNMSETFNRFTGRFQENQDNKDSLKRMIDEAYDATDDYLRSNERLKTASLILAGSWLEAQHLTVNSLLGVERTTKNEVLFKRVWEQGLHLDNIVKVLDALQNDDDQAMVKIRDVYLNLLEIYKEPKDPKDVNQELLQKLSKSIAEVRDRVIS